MALFTFVPQLFILVFDLCGLVPFILFYFFWVPSFQTQLRLFWAVTSEWSWGGQSSKKSHFGEQDIPWISHTRYGTKASPLGSPLEPLKGFSSGQWDDLLTVASNYIPFGALGTFSALTIWTEWKMAFCLWFIKYPQEKLWLVGDGGGKEGWKSVTKCCSLPLPKIKCISSF